jgi:hypothetical protein
MPLIQIPVGVTPCQVDDFPVEISAADGTKRPFERSCKGALHFRPATTRRVTQDEMDHIKAAKQHAALGRKIFEVKITKKAPAKAPRKVPPPLPPPKPILTDL